METAKQLSVQLINKPGRFAAVLAALQKEKVAIRAFCVMDTGARGTVRMVPDDPARATKTIEGLNVKVDVADVLLVEVNGQSGGLPNLCKRLAEGHLNLDYAYGSISAGSGAKGGSLAVIKVNDLAKAQRLLSEPAGGAAARPKKKPGRRPVHAR